jgi:hypothetical protein
MILHHVGHQEMESFFYDCSHHQLGNEEARQSNQEMQELYNSEAGAGSNFGNSPILKDSRILALHSQQSGNKNINKYKYFLVINVLGFLKGIDGRTRRERIKNENSDTVTLHIHSCVCVWATTGDISLLS